MASSKRHASGTRPLYKILRDLGLTQLQSEHSVLIKLDDKGRKLQKQARKSNEEFLGYHVGPKLIVAVYVDDLLIIGKTREVMKQFKQRFAIQVSIKGLNGDDDDARNYLSIKISRNRGKGTLRLL